MDQFKGLYYEYCQTYYIEPNETILGEITKYEVFFLNEIWEYKFFLYKDFGGRKWNEKF